MGLCYYLNKGEGSLPGRHAIQRLVVDAYRLVEVARTDSSSTSTYSAMKSAGLRSARVNVGDVYARSMSKGGSLDATDLEAILAQSMAAAKDDQV
jgi:hypothetical protein